MKCTLCPRACGIERNTKAHGFCGVDDTLRIARAALHAWEEPVISGKCGSGTVFFSGCNLRCVFCQNHAVSHEALGRPVTEEELADVFLSLQEAGAHNINLVTPSHYAHVLRRVLEAVKPRLSIPVVWNSGGYETVETLRTLEGLVDIYLPDVKYYSSELSAAYSAASDYFPVAMEALAEMLRQQPDCTLDEHGLLTRGTVVRHLILPGCREDSIALLRSLAERFGTKGYLLSLMCQYTPEFAKDCAYKNLHRKLTTFEYRSVQEEATRLGFDGFSQSPASASADFTPQFSGN